MLQNESLKPSFPKTCRSEPVEKSALLYNLAAVEAANLVKTRPKVKSPTFPAAQAGGDHTSTARL